MGRLRWIPAAFICLLATWYGSPVPLRCSAAAVVLAATAAWSLSARQRLLGATATAISLGASVWAWRTIGHTFLDIRADADKELFWTTIEVAGLAALGGRLAYAQRLSGLLLLVPGGAVSLRLLPGSPLPQQLFLAGLGATAVGSAILLGQRLNSRNRAEADAVQQARAEQRHLLAADLHDYVAHDIAAIAVLAQSVRLVHGPQVQQSIAQIEQAAARALRQLDRSIALLHLDPRSAQPRYGLADLPKLAADHPMPVTLTMLVGNDDDVPAAVQDTTHRVITEALTNAGRHAPSTSAVHVSVTRDDRQLHIAVVNEFLPRPSSTRGPGTGLAALGERVRSLGGELRAGAAETHWEVTASIPLD